MPVTEKSIYNFSFMNLLFCAQVNDEIIMMTCILLDCEYCDVKNCNPCFWLVNTLRMSLALKLKTGI
jgi:hypothetical protein